MEKISDWWKNNTVRQSSEVMVGHVVQDGSILAAVEGTPRAKFLEAFPLDSKARIDFTEVRRVPIGPWAKVIDSAKATEIELI